MIILSILKLNIELQYFWLLHQKLITFSDHPLFNTIVGDNIENSISDLQTLDKCTGEHYKKRLLQKHSGTNATDDHFDNSTNIEDHVLNNNNNKMYRNQVQSGFESDKHVLQTAAEMQPTEKTKIKETLLNAVEFELQALNNNNSSSISSKIDGDNMQGNNLKFYCCLDFEIENKLKPC